jgi:hypothetical protein
MQMHGSLICLLSSPCAQSPARIDEAGPNAAGAALSVKVCTV